MKSLGIERLPEEQAYRRRNCKMRNQRTVRAFIGGQRTRLWVYLKACRASCAVRLGG